MLSESKNIMKLKMLNEFERQIDNILEEYDKGNISSRRCVSVIKALNATWAWGRMDLKNYGNIDNKIQILENNKVKIKYPSWFKNNYGEGCLITSPDKIKISFKCNNKGHLKIFLRSLDYANLKDHRVPIYINCNTLKINEKDVLGKDTLVHHDEPYTYDIEYTNINDVINVSLNFESIHDYFPLLNLYLSDVDNDNFLIRYNNVKSYITYEKILIKLNDLESDIYNAMIDL